MYGGVTAGTAYSTNVPSDGSYRATLPAKCSANHIFPLESREIAFGRPTAQSANEAEQYPIGNSFHSSVEGLKLPN